MVGVARLNGARFANEGVDEPILTFSKMISISLTLKSFSDEAVSQAMRSFRAVVRDTFMEVFSMVIFTLILVRFGLVVARGLSVVGRQEVC